MRTRIACTAVTTAALVAAGITGTTASGAAAPGAGAATSSQASRQAASSSYVVLFAPGASEAAARAAITAAGGTVVSANAAVGYAAVTSSASGFATAAASSPAIEGAARNRSIGRAPAQQRARTSDIEALTAAERELAATTAAARARTAAPSGAAGGAASPAGDPLSGLQWDMRAIHATPQGSYAVEPGSRGIKVGIIDTGVDGSHPDIAPNFDRADSRNFTKDMPDIDGPCEVASCVDPADVDQDGHGTHVASTIGAPVNGIGISGVAPGVSLVNLRAGQDSGYFFLQPTLDAISAAGDLGVDVVNMSFYTDPWLFNCTANPADSREEQQEQRTIIEATQRALDYARSKGVLAVAASGNESTDLGEPGKDTTSPDYPVDAKGNPTAARERTIDNSTCLSVPSESNGVVTVNATGPSGRKAYYSNYGTEESDVSAPGGDAYDTPTGRLDVHGLVLAAYPANVAKAEGTLNPDGTPNTPFVVRDCQGGTCAYYQYLQGTSMASPHAAGVAALVASRYGSADAAHPGELGLAPRWTSAILLGTATDTACPTPREFTYRVVRASGATTSTATCDGPSDDNGFYGEGVVDALGAVTGLPAVRPAP